jgi:hypothetical protein
MHLKIFLIILAIFLMNKKASLAETKNEDLEIVKNIELLENWEILKDYEFLKTVDKNTEEKLDILEGVEDEDS